MTGKGLGDTALYPTPRLSVLTTGLLLARTTVEEGAAKLLT